MKQKNLRIKGEVIEALPSTTFRVKTETGEKVLCHLAGKLRFYRIKILPGDKVLIEVSPYDKSRGRIIYRLK